MIIPDDKDWTWVLVRPCPECGFDASTCPAPEVPALVRANVTSWQDLQAAGTIQQGRSDPSRWSSLEYACHVRDVYKRYLVRIELMLAEDDPLFENWDQDESALEDAYGTQDPKVVTSALVDAGEAVAGLLESLSHTSWTRPGRRSDGAAFTVDTIARYMIHDPIHHLWDVTGCRSQ